MKTLLLIISLLFLLPALSLAQRDWEGSGWISGPNNSHEIVKISGEIERVEFFMPRKDMSEGIRIVIKTDKGSIPVHLGPYWYFKRMSVNFLPGDRLQVAGTLTTFNKEPVIMAWEIKKGGKVLKLRDENGIPQWQMRKYPLN